LACVGLKLLCSKQANTEEQEEQNRQVEGPDLETVQTTEPVTVQPKAATSLWEKIRSQLMKPENVRLMTGIKKFNSLHCKFFKI
jgi:hypothetical protein